MMLWKYLVKRYNLTNEKLFDFRSKLAAVYALAGWHVVILIFLYSNEHNFPNTSEKRDKFIKKEQENKEVHVMRIDGFHVVENSEAETTKTDS